MSDVVTLTLRAALAERVDADGLTADRLASLSGAQISAIELWHGRRRVRLGDLFDISGGRSSRVRIVGDPGSGCSSNQYGQFNTAAFAGPNYGSLGLESGRNYLTGCPDKTLDFAIARNFRLGGSRTAQFRIDLFNAFNTVVIDGRVTQLQLTNPTTQVVRNNQYNADGSVNAERLTPRTAGFGAANGAQNMRSVQIQLRFQF